MLRRCPPVDRSTDERTGRRVADHLLGLGFHGCSNTCRQRQPLLLFSLSISNDFDVEGYCEYGDVDLL